MVMETVESDEVFGGNILVPSKKQVAENGVASAFLLMVFGLVSPTNSFSSHRVILSLMIIPSAGGWWGLWVLSSKHFSPCSSPLTAAALCTSAPWARPLKANEIRELHMVGCKLQIKLLWNCAKVTFLLFLFISCKHESESSELLLCVADIRTA